MLFSSSITGISRLGKQIFLTSTKGQDQWRKQTVIHLKPTKSSRWEHNPCSGNTIHMKDYHVSKTGVA